MVIWSNPPAHQGPLEPVAQEFVQMAFEYLQEWKLHNLHGKPVPGLSHPHSEKEFPDVQREPPVFQFVPIASGPATGHLIVQNTLAVFSEKVSLGARGKYSSCMFTPLWWALGSHNY